MKTKNLLKTEHCTKQNFIPSVSSTVKKQRRFNDAVYNNHYQIGSNYHLLDSDSQYNSNTSIQLYWYFTWRND